MFSGVPSSGLFTPPQLGPIISGISQSPVFTGVPLVMEKREILIITQCIIIPQSASFTVLLVFNPLPPRMSEIHRFSTLQVKGD